MLSAPPSFALGEALRVALISTDETVAVFAEAIPYRLDASAGCTVEGEMLSLEGFAFSGSGFTPGETLEVVSRSDRNIIRRTATADDGGRLPTVIVLPTVRGRSGGDATIEVTGESCRVVLRYGWGDKLRGPRQSTAPRDAQSIHLSSDIQGSDRGNEESAGSTRGFPAMGQGAHCGASRR
jgi:hypothetical protein